MGMLIAGRTDHQVTAQNEGHAGISHDSDVLAVSTIDSRGFFTYV